MILSINTDVLEPVLMLGNAGIYLLQKGRPAAYKDGVIGKKLDAAKDEKFLYTRR